MRTFPFPQSVGAFLGAIPVALQGYVIVATDYAGLDVELDSKWKPIVHEYMASPAAEIMLFTLLKLRQASPQLS